MLSYSHFTELSVPGEVTQWEREVAEMGPEHVFLKPKHVCHLHRDTSVTEVFVSDMEVKGQIQKVSQWPKVMMNNDKEQFRPFPVPGY